MALSAWQEQVANDAKRFRTVIAGRRAGKTHLAIRELCYHARLPDSDVWYVSPSYKQSKNIVWRKLKKRLTELNWAEKINESELSIRLRNGSMIS